MLESQISVEQGKSSVELKDIVGGLGAGPYSNKRGNHMIEKLGIDYAERRLYKRGPGIRLPCLLCSDDSQEVNCTLLDISPVGAKVKLDSGLDDGERIDLTAVQRMIVSSLVNFPAEVIWQNGPFVGFRFLSDAQEAADAIIRLLPECLPLDDIEVDAA
jgi:hypothetical protein